LKRVVGGIVLLAIALLAYFLFRGDDEVSAEAKYDGVHLCSPDQQEAATVAARSDLARPTPSGNLDLEPSRTLGPLFAQNATAWGDEEYDHGRQQDVGCGQTIAQCGCAMTSVATVLSLFQLLATPQGDDLNPSTLNGWFNQGAQLTSGGWVSQGYSYGNVIWTAVNNFSAVVPGSERAQSVRFAGWGSGDVDEIKAQLARGNGVVVEVPGHYVAALRVQGDEVLINDPYYPERTTLSFYQGRVRSIRIYQPGQDLSGMMVTVPADKRVRITDAQGRVVGTLDGKTPQEMEQQARTQIPGAIVKFEEAWRDPTCTERPPEDGKGTISIFVPNPQDGNYKVEVEGARDTSVVVSLYDKGGNLRQIVREGGARLEFEFSYSGGGGGQTQPGVTPTPTATPTETPTPTPTPTPEPEVESPVQPPQQPEPEEPEPPITPTFTPTPTITPVPATATAMWVTPLTVPKALGSSIAPSQGCFTTISWNAGGDPEGKVELLRNMVPIFTRGIGPAQYSDPFAVGTWSYAVRATNSDGIVTSTAPVQVIPSCLTEYKLDYVNCDDYTCVRHMWKVAGNQNGTVRIVHTPTGAVVGIVPISSGNFITPDPVDCPNDFQITVTVAGASVSSPVVRAPGGFFNNCSD
jgi:hypothetical protein